MTRFPRLASHPFNREVPNHGKVVVRASTLLGFTTPLMASKPKATAVVDIPRVR